MDYRRRKAVALFTFLAIATRPKIKKKRERRWRVKPILQNQNIQGDWSHLVQEMKLTDHEMFFSYTSLTKQMFAQLLHLTGPHLQKESLRRTPLPIETRLALTLRYLATGESYGTISSTYHIGKSTACIVIRETCAVLCKVLSPIYLRMPTEEEWKNIAEDFYTYWNLPNCLGAIDGKYVNIRAPNNGTIHHKTYDVILFAISDASFNFSYVDIGSYSSENDGGVLRESSFGQALFNDDLQIPQNQILPNTNIDMPFFFVGDEAFPLHKNLFRPYGDSTRTNLDRPKKIFNQRLSRARKCIENAFGVLVSRFRVFEKTINTLPETADLIIQATVCLHNFIKEMEQSMHPNKRKYCTPQYTDRYDENGELILGEWRNHFVSHPALGDLRDIRRRLGTRNTAKSFNQLRDNYADYVTSENGSVAWQNKIV